MVARVAAAFTVAAAATGVALAAHPARIEQRRANLDTDRPLEMVRISEVPSVNHASSTAGVTVVDRCGGRARRYAIVSETGGSPIRVGSVEVVNADGVTRRPELFAWIGGGRPGSGIVSVHRMDRVRGRACPRPRVLLRYAAQTPPDPLAGLTLVAVSASIGDSAAHRGLEVQIVEQWRSLGDLPARTERRLDYRYDAARGRYVRFATKLIPRGGA